MAKRPAKKPVVPPKEEPKVIKATPKKTPTKVVKAGPKKAVPRKAPPTKEEPKSVPAKRVVQAVKKVVKKEPIKRTLKKGPEIPDELKPKPIPISERIGPAKTKRLPEDKYIRVANDADIEKFKEMSSRIQSGSIQWAYFGVDGDKGYHYYLVLKN